MGYLAKLDTAKEDATLEQERLGSVLMTAGGVFLGMALLFGIYNFVDFREGTHLMLAVSGGFAFLGLLLMAIGEWKKKTNAV